MEHGKCRPELRPGLLYRPELCRTHSGTVKRYPDKTAFFIKPALCLVKPREKIHFPKHGNELHHEVEVVVQISRGGKVKTEEEARNAIGFITLGLDLTLRDVQDEQKKKGLPWAISSRLISRLTSMISHLHARSTASKNNGEIPGT